MIHSTQFNSHRHHSAAASSGAGISSTLRDQIEESVEYQILKKNFGEYLSLNTDAEEATKDVYDKPRPSNEMEIETTQSQMQISLSRQETLEFELTLDGEHIRLKVETLESFSVEQSVQQAKGVRKADPLVLDLNNDGVKTSGWQQGVRFDLDADGQQELTSVPVEDNVLVAWDKNKNGIIDDGRELFGDQTGYQHGFAALAAQDENRDGKIDRQDAVFSELSLLRWTRQGQQLSPLAQRVEAIDLNFQEQKTILENGDEVTQSGLAADSQGKRLGIYDLLLSLAE